MYPNHRKTLLVTFVISIKLSFLFEGLLKEANGFGLKYIDTSSLEFGRKIDTVDLVAEKEPYASNHSNEEETISSSLSVSSSETVQIEASLNDQELVKPSRVKKRNFASKDPSKSSNILKSHIDSNNFRHTSKSAEVQEDEKVG